MDEHSVLITGLGAVSALGHGVAALREALFAGRHGIGPVERFDVSAFGAVRIAALVPPRDGDRPPDEEACCEAWAVDAALEAWRDAEPAPVAPERIAVVVGTGEGEGDVSAVAARVAEAIGAGGPRLTISTACASSANAIGFGADLLLRGDADVVVAGGAERLMPEMFAGFYRLGVLGEAPCAPFGEARGTTLGEGAGFVVLERAPAAPTGRMGPPDRFPERRGWAFLNGYGLSSDAFHETSPEPRGAGLARAIRGCLQASGLTSADVGYVNAHGTGTAANDDAEWRGLAAALAEHAPSLPVSSTKSFLGHAQGAAGVLELAATLVCLRQGSIPPTLRVGDGRPGGPPDPVAGERPRPTQLRHALSNSSAFGGANAVLCVGRPSRPPQTARRTVRVRGLAEVLVAPGVCRDEAALSAAAPGVDLRSTDPSARFCLAACARALDDAELRVRGPLRERAGIFGGTRRVSPASLDDYRRSAERGGLGRVSAVAFARLVVNAPIGFVSRALALRGPTTTVASRSLGGLAAFAYAASWLSWRRDADVLLACGHDERAAGEGGLQEGAACLVLQADSGAGPRVEGAAFAGPGRLSDAIGAALARAGRSEDDIERWVLSERPFEVPGGAPSLSSARLLIEGVGAARAGTERVVVGADGLDLACAVVLAAG